MDDWNQGPPDLKSSALNPPVTPPPQILKYAGFFSFCFFLFLFLKLVYSISGICGGALFGAITLGMFVPRVNSKVRRNPRESESKIT